jgi:hypothetical protein
MRSRYSNHVAYEHVALRLHAPSFGTGKSRHARDLAESRTGVPRLLSGLSEREPSTTRFAFVQPTIPAPRCR